MALDYDTDPTGIFFRGGRVIDAVNSHLANATTTLPAELKNIADPFEESDLTGQVSGLFAAYEGMKQAEVSNRQQLAAVWDAILADRPTVVEELGLASADVNAVLAALVVRMLTDSETVNASAVSIGSVTAHGSNVGNGTVLLTKLLDGSTPPLAGSPSMTAYAGLDSELAVNETMTFVCVADSGQNGLPEGSEQFSWSGELAGPPFDYEDEGSGPGPNLTVASGQSLVTDGDFELWGGTGNNTPTNWTIDNGTAGTHIFRESTVFHRGTYALKFTGDGAAATIGVSQTIPTGQMRARKTYCVSLRMRCSTAPSAGTFDAKFTGTGYTASSTEKINIAHGSLPTSFTLYHFFICTPAVIPSDWKLVVQVLSTLESAKSVYVDSLAVVEVPYHGGLGAVVVAGANRFAVGDRFTSAITNTGGVIQQFFRRKYGVQLPSNGAGAETILDSLAT